MSTAYELTFFLGMGFTAIVAAIYVLSVTQIGKATELFAVKQKEILTNQKSLATEQIERLQKQLDEARQTGRLDDEKVKQELTSSQDKLKSYEVLLKRLNERKQLLERRGAVVWPGSSFLVTTVFSIAATAINTSNGILALVLWIIGILALIFGIYRVFRTLGAIQEVTISSQESIDRLPEAVKTALLEIENLKKPELSVEFIGEQPPLHFKRGQESAIRLSISVSKGEVAKNITIFVACPPGFEIIHTPLCGSPAPEQYANYSSAIFTEDHLTLGVYLNFNTFIKAPKVPGKYICIYKLSCEGFDKPWTPFDTLVE